MDFALDNKALIILFVLTIFSAFASPVFFTSTNLINVIRQISTIAIMGIGFTCILASGNMDLSVGSLLGMLGVIMAMLSKVIPLPAALLIGLIIGALCGATNAVIGVYLRMPLFIVTLAMGQVFRGIAFLLSNTSPITGLPAGFRFIGQGYMGFIPIPIVITAVVGVIVWILLNKTIFGRHAIATGGNREAARTSGINVNRTTILVYMLMGVCAGIAAAVMTGRTASAQHIAGQGMEMDAIAAVVIGGTQLGGGSGKIVGTLFGCMIVGVIANILNLMGVDSNWQLVAKGALILFAVGLDVVTTTYINTKMRKA